MVRPTQPDLLARRVNSYAIGLFGAVSYLERRGRPRTPADLIGHDLIGHDRDDSVVKGFAAAGMAIDRTDFALRCDDHAVCWAMMAAGLGLGFGPVWVGGRTPGVERIRLAMRLPVLEMWLCTHREVATSRRLRLVMDALAESLGALPLGEGASA